MSKLYKVTIDESFSSGGKKSYYTKELEETIKTLETKGYVSIPLARNVRGVLAYYRETECRWNFDEVMIEEQIVNDSYYR